MAIPQQKACDQLSELMGEHQRLWTIARRRGDREQAEFHRQEVRQLQREISDRQLRNDDEPIDE